MDTINRIGTRRSAPAFAITLASGFVIATPARAQSYSVLYSFQCGPNDGECPASGLVSDPAGKVYGTTGQGGTYGWGTIFEVSPTGTETVPYNFKGPPDDGGAPGYGALARDAAGNLYGSTIGGGSQDIGTIFRLSPGGKETILANPGHLYEGFVYGGVILDSKGNLYGAAAGNFGTIFEIPAGGNTNDGSNWPEGCLTSALVATLGARVSAWRVAVRVIRECGRPEWAGRPLARLSWMP